MYVTNEVNNIVIKYTFSSLFYKKYIICIKTIDFGAELIAGYYDDQSIYSNRGNGLEAQPFKLTNATEKYGLIFNYSFN